MDQNQPEALVERIEVLEGQPLQQRAAGYEQLAEELRVELERSDREVGAD